MNCFNCREDISDRKIDGKQAILCEKCEKARASTIVRGVAINGAIARSDFYKKDVDKGVKGRDLLQPFNKDGKYNKEFFHHWGDKAFTTAGDKERIKRELG